MSPLARAGRRLLNLTLLASTACIAPALRYSAFSVTPDSVAPKASANSPQKANKVTDPRANALTRDARGVYVNSYIPSELTWTQGATRIRLTQKSLRPYGSHVEIEVKATKPTDFVIYLRIPAWARGASIAVNGKRQVAAPGSFARVQREWKTGDRIELKLPMKAGGGD